MIATTTPVADAPKPEVQTYDPDNLPAGIYHWPVDKDMTARVSEMLKFDFASLGIKGTYVLCPLLKCHSCGKTSGLDDFIYGAMKVGVHNVSFMVKALVENLENKSPAHKLWCSGCGEVFLESDAIISPATDSWFEFAKQAAFGLVGLGNVKAAAVRWAGFWEDRSQKTASVRWAGFWEDRAGKTASVRWAGFWEDRAQKTASVRWAGFWEDRAQKTATVRWAGFWEDRAQKAPQVEETIALAA